MMSVITTTMSLDIDNLNGEVRLYKGTGELSENGAWDRKTFVEAEDKEVYFCITCSDTVSIGMSAHHMPGTDGGVFHSSMDVELSISDLRELHKFVSCVLEQKIVAE